MSQIGYYRYKVSDAFTGSQTVEFYINGAKVKTVTIEARKFCPGFKYLKYLNRDGQYRFFAFNSNWQQSDKPSLIGKTNSFVSSILDSQSDQKVVGYKNERKVSFVAEHVSQDELNSLVDIFTSPRIYLYVGSGTDQKKDWVMVTVSGDGIGKPRKSNYKKVTLEITLPTHFTISKS